MTAKTGAARQAEYRLRAWKAGRDRLDIKLPSTSLIALERLAKHRGQYQWEVLVSLINDAAARELPGNASTAK